MFLIRERRVGSKFTSPFETRDARCGENGARTCANCGAFRLFPPHAYEDLMQLNLELYAFDPFAERVWELRHNVASYHAWYIAIAEALQLPLATLDERLVKAKGPACNFLTPGSSGT